MRHILHAQKTVDIATDELAAISRLFSAGVVREMARKGRSPQLSAEFRQLLRHHNGESDEGFCTCPASRFLVHLNQGFGRHKLSRN